MIRKKFQQAVDRLQEPLQHEQEFETKAVTVPDVSALCLIDALAAMCDAVHDMRYTAIEPVAMLDALDDYDRVISSGLNKRIQERRLGLSLPPTEEDIEVSGLCIELHTHLANGYKSAIPNLRGGEHARKETEQFLRAACGAIHHLKRALVSAYECYRVEPKGIWVAIHRIYARACQLDLHNACATQTDERGTQDLNIARIYKQALLLGLCNPYQLPFRIIHTVDSSLEKWADHAELSVEHGERASRCRFLIDPNLDRPGVPLLSQRGMDMSADHWILDTTAVAAELREEMQTLIKNFAKSAKRLDSFNNFAMLEMLRALIGRWGSHRVRGSQRKKHGGYCDLAIGMNSVSYVVNGMKSYEVYNEPANITVGDNVFRGSFGEQQAKQKGDVRLSKSWQIADVSQSGFRLTLQKSEKAQIQMNELIAVRPRDLSMGWLTGLVQWARYNEDGELDIGARTLSTEARPVSVSVFTLSHEASRGYTMGLFLPERNDSDPMVIIPAGLYHPNRVFAVRFEDGEQTVRVNRLIMSTRAFDWFEVHIDNTDREYMLRAVLPH